MSYTPLEQPLRVTDHKWNEGTIPYVSILCSTYNHAPYIKQCIDSLLMQETTFPVEIIIRDDASTDGTTEIVDNYGREHPNIVKCILEPENQYVKGGRALSVLAQNSRGSYTAICEGDDYWTTTDKLEKQIFLLEANPESHMCVAKTRMVHDDLEKSKEDVVFEGLPKKFLTFKDFYDKCYMHTSTYVLRSFSEIYEIWGDKLRLSDTSLRYIYADLGPVVFLPEVVSVYRITGKGTWTRLSNAKKLDQEIILHELFYKYFKREYRGQFSMKLLIQYKDAMLLQLKQRDLCKFFRYSGGFVRHCILSPLSLLKLVKKSIKRVFTTVDCLH